MRRYCPIAILAAVLLASCATVSEESPYEALEEEAASLVIVMEEPAAAVADEAPEGEAEAAAEEPAVDFAIISAQPREQSAILSVQFPKGTDPALLSVEGGGRITAIRGSGTAAEVTVSELESLSSYSISLAYDGKAVTAPYDIRTGSFAGRYSWQPADGSEAEPFFLLAEEAPAGSDYRYYIYLDPQDSAFPEGYGEREIRIAPLIDRGEPSLDEMKYRDAPEGYKWTNSKWNTGSMTPSRIAYVRPQETDTGDVIHTLVASVALGFTAESDVHYLFHERDGVDYLIFHNSMSPGIANSFLKKNPSPGIRPYEVNEYWYTLERVE